MEAGHRQMEVGRPTNFPVWANDATSVAALEYFEIYPGLPKVFHCERLRADITAASCITNSSERHMSSCMGCAIGKHHLDELLTPVQQAVKARHENIHARAEAARGLACVRCERSAMTAGRFIGSFRLVRRHTVCVSCFNREKEVVAGRNSKGATPKKWSGLGITQVVMKGKPKVFVDIGYTMGHGESLRLCARRWPGETVSKVIFNGVAIKSDPNPVPSVERRIAQAPECAHHKKLKALQVTSGREACGPCKRGRPLKVIEPILGESCVAPEIAPPIASEPVEQARAEPAVPSADVDAGVTPEPAVVLRGRGAPNLQGIRHESGDRFGSLIAIEPIKSTYWRYRCDCGNEPLKPIGRVKRGLITNCGPDCTDGKLIEDFYPVANLVEFLMDRLGVPSREKYQAGVADQITKPATPALVEPLRRFSTALHHLGFTAGRRYESVMPLAIAEGTRVLFGCLCGETFIATSQSVLKGHRKDCGCGFVQPVEPTFTQYLAQRVERVTLRGVSGNTHENAIAIAVGAYRRSIKRNTK